MHKAFNALTQVPYKKLAVDLLMFIVFMILFLFTVWLFYIFYVRGPIQTENRGFVTKTAEVETPKPTQVKEYMVEHFHNLDDMMLGGIKYKSDCVLCHGSYAHSESEKVRTFFNAHSWFVACEVCHVNPDEGETFVYRWFDNESNEEISELQGLPGSYGARIAPAKVENGVLARVGVYSGPDFIEQYLRRKLELNVNVVEMKPAMTEVHVSLAEEPVDCDGCHALEGRLPFREILYAENDAEHLESLDVGAMVKTYEEFHFPSLYDGEGIEYRLRPTESEPAPESEPTPDTSVNPQ